MTIAWEDGAELSVVHEHRETLSVIQGPVP